MKRFILFSAIIAILAGNNIFGQGIEGKVVDIDGNAVSYASIFIKELTRGTTTNSIGVFSLPLPAGEYNIFFRSLGYTEVARTVTITDKIVNLQVVMPPQTYMIPEVRISANGEDPAYRVMRKAIGLANYHLNQVNTYDATIYIKGTAYFNRLPKAIANRLSVGGSEVKIKENKAYMLESLNDVTYHAPDRYDMRIIASQNTIPGFSESVNPMDYINASLYQPEIESFVSPLARNAFTYYKFNFAGSFLQGSYMIDKIEVIPKRKSQQLCSGYIFIVEDLWCLYSSDLEVNTIAGTLYLQQQYANIIMDAWLPVSHKLEMKVEIAGVDADVTYVSSLEYKKTELNANLPKSYFEPQKNTEPEIEEEVSEEQIKIQSILEKEEINDRDMAKLTRLMEKETEKASTNENKLHVEGTKFSIAPNAVMNDSSFWNEIRPVPLTLEEKGTLAIRDSIMGFGRKDSNMLRDTTKVSKKHKLRPSQFLMGSLFQSSDRKTKVRYGGLIDPTMLSFNTVDGFSYGQKLSYDYRPTTKVAYRWYLDASYAFGRKAPLIRWNSNILYAPKIRGKIALNMDYTSADFNDITGIPTFTNSVYSLFLRENHSKRFEKRSVVLEHRMDLATGLVFYATAEYLDTRELTNHSDFSFFFRDSTFTSNYPENMENNPDMFNDTKSFSARILLEYTHDYYYRLKNGRKQYFKSDYPTIYAVYKHAIPFENTGWADYNLLYGGLRHERELGLLSTLEYKVEGGIFLKTDEMHFSEFKHFKSSPLLIDMIGFNESLLLMDYYRASTNSSYLQAHGRITTPYLLIKMLPWFSERLWNECVSLDYLITPAINNHIQLGYSLEEIAFLMDIGVYVVIEDWKYYGTALRFNFRF